MIFLTITSGIISLVSGIKFFRANQRRKIYSGQVRYSSLPGDIPWSPQMASSATKTNIFFVISAITGSFFLWSLSSIL